MPGKKDAKPRYAARLNAFRAIDPSKYPTAVESMIANARKVSGIDAAELNYPDHFVQHDAMHMARLLSSHGLALNGLAMRYYSEPEFAAGAFTNHDPKVRQRAIDLTKRGLDTLERMGGSLMTLWMGQDGFDYSFQANYQEVWDWTVHALTEVADHNPAIDISIEYKPNEPRAFALMPDVSTTLLGIKEVSRNNLGVTLDFAHVLYADEMPAHAVRLAVRHGRLLGIHLNDGYRKRDDGLMVGTVHPIQTVELFVELFRIGYDGVIYFDTFPDHSGLDPVEECRTNIAICEKLAAIAAELANDEDLKAAIAVQNATRTQRIVASRLFGKD